MALTLCVGFVVDDAIVMLENITRHMEMGKSPDAGDARRLEGDRLHHRVDDAVARGGVHPGAVHGRHPRAAAARVRGDDHRRGADLGLRFADADAAAVQPHAQGRARAAARPPVCAFGADLRRDARRLSRRASRWVLAASPIHDGGLLRPSSSARVLLFYYMPKGFLPSDDVGQLFVFTEAAQDISFEAMSNLQQQVAADRARRIRTCKASMSFVGVGGPERSRSTTAAYSSRSSRAQSARRPTRSFRSCGPR